MDPVKEHQSGGRRRRWWMVILLVGVAAAVVLWTTRGTGDGDARSAATAGIPGLEGSLRIAVGGTNPHVLTWAPGAAEPTRVDLTPRTVYAVFDASGRWLASRTASGIGNTLSLSGSGDPQPLAIGVSSFAWHATAEGKLAWFGTTADGIPGLFVASASRGTVDVDLLTQFDIDAGVGDGLQAWGDWGFAVFNRSNPDASLATLDQDGDEVAHGPMLLGGVRPNGTLIVGRLEGDARLIDAWFFTDESLQSGDRVPWEFETTPAWSQSGEKAAFVSDDGAMLSIQPEGLHLTLDPPAAIAIGWSPDDRFALLIGEDRALVYNVETTSLTVLDTDAPVWDIAVMD